MMSLMRMTAALCLAAGVASADPILSNLPGSSSGSGTNLGVGTDLVDRTKGVGLTMGATSMDFVSMVALISNGGTSAATLSGGIFAASGGNPGAMLAAFTGVSVGAGAQPAEITMQTASTFTLQANTSYWFVLDGPSVTNSLLWNSLSPNAAPTAAAGMTFDGYRFSSNGGTTWGASSIFNGMTINAVVPAPGAMALLGLGGLAAARRRR